MDEICRLCCSSKFVNNNIFDEENALYIKMSLYLPIKVFRNDRLPQKICDKCSCKVNDFYQFCNEAIDVQNRLKSLLDYQTDVTIDLTVVKPEISIPTIPQPQDQSTQTDFTDLDVTKIENTKPDVVVKVEEAHSPLDVKKEDDVDTDDFVPDVPSDNSDDDYIITRARSKKTLLPKNGVVKEKKAKKNKSQFNDWEMLDPTKLLSKEFDVNSDKVVIKQEAVEVQPQDLGLHLEVRGIKKEGNDSHLYYCCVCFEHCTTKNEMLQHYKRHASAVPRRQQPPPAPPLPDDGNLRCHRCSKVLENADAWRAHWRRHWERDQHPYRCTVCEKTFRDHHQILKHGMTHKSGEAMMTTPSKRYMCDLCPESFAYMRCLQAHRTVSHPAEAARALALRCGVCQRQFAHLNSLRRHLTAHSGERNYLCNVCGKALTSREHLKFHIRIHTGYKPNVCNVCGKGFVKKCNLTLHERVHSGEKPHVCSHCGKAFSQRSTLVIHERYHSGARPYACGVCGRGFVAKGLLSMHLKTACVDLAPHGKD